MASERQIAANRSNAQRSTGPRTKAGKLKSSRNSLKHGLSSSKNGVWTASSTAVTEVQLALERIRRVRVKLLLAVLESREPRLIKQLRGLDRYERTALAKRKRVQEQ